MSTTDTALTLEACIDITVKYWPYPQEEPQLRAELAELRRKAGLTDRLLDEVLHHRERRIWNESFGATSEQAQKRAYDSMVREGLVPKARAGAEQGGTR
jgi:hypothetical protein